MSSPFDDIYLVELWPDDGKEVIESVSLKGYIQAVYENIDDTENARVVIHYVWGGKRICVERTAQLVFARLKQLNDPEYMKEHNRKVMREILEGPKNKPGPIKGSRHGKTLKRIALWNDGMSVKEIDKSLNVTKNKRSRASHTIKNDRRIIQRTLRNNSDLLTRPYPRNRLTSRH